MSYTNLSIKNLPHSEVEISGSIPTESVASYRKAAVDYLTSKVTIPGFRQGKVPENILMKHVGEMALLEEMAERALAEVYPLIIEEKKLEIIDRPEIRITKLAPQNPLEFVIKVAVKPVITLADYQSIAKEAHKEKDAPIEVTEKEIDDVILEVRKSRVDHSKHDHSKSKEEHDKEVEQNIPEFTDEFVKTLGDFKDVGDFKEKLRTNMKEDKERKAKEKKRLQIVESIISASTIDVPNLLVEHELAKMLGQFRDDLVRMGLKQEDYLKRLGKTEEDLRKEWREDAEKRAKLSLILHEIALKEKLIPSDDDTEKEVTVLTAHYPDVDKERARVYARTVLANEKVFAFFEAQK